MIVEGLTLTVIGMIVVFVFLALLVVVMLILSAFVRRFLPETATPAGVAPGKQETEIAVAVAAISAMLGRPVGAAGDGRQAEVAAAVTAVKAHTTK